MHGLVLTRKKVSLPRGQQVKFLQPHGSAADQMRKNGELLAYRLPEAVYEAGTLHVDRHGVFFKRKRKVFKMADVRFSEAVHNCGAAATVLLTRKGHGTNHVVVLASRPACFDTTNRVPCSRFEFVHLQTTPCVLGATAEPCVLFRRPDITHVIVQCPPFRTATYDKRRFSFVDQDGKVLCEVQGRRYHIRHQSQYYLTCNNEVLCPTFTE